VDVAFVQVVIVDGGNCDDVDDESGFEINFDLARSYCLRIKLDRRERFLFGKGFSYVTLVFFFKCDDEEDEVQEDEDCSNVTGRIS
jgi:hypothetical protein